MNNSLPGLSIPLGRIGACLDCLVAFDMSDGPACPKCGSEIGLVSVRITGEKPARETND